MSQPAFYGLTYPPHFLFAQITTSPSDLFSVFNSSEYVATYHYREIDEERGMLLEIVAGPLKGERRRVRRDGATVGRATDSTIRLAALFFLLFFCVS